MLTRCPSCQSWFRVRAEHLSAAGGRVTCGACDAVFNALDTLVEQ
ncbi:MAG: MJ0042-type zinc finger domain-containing protein, partial [Gammaproteobacteria bacterium]